MYFALMLLTLFVACSFGAMAESEVPTTCEHGQYDALHGCITPAPSKSGYIFTDEGVSGDVSESLEAAFTSFATKFSYSQISSGVDGFCTWTTTVTRGAQLISIDQARLEIKYSRLSSSSSSYSTTTNGVTCPTVSPSSNTVERQGYARETGLVHYCPPEAPYSDFLLRVTIGGVEHCVKKLQKPNNCFSSPDFKIANQYHFDPLSQGKGQVCVKNDKAQNCPWKELPGSNGVFQPDIQNKSACDVAPPPPLSDPADKPQDPEKCTPGGNGMMVCKADPNEKCAVNSTGAMSCPDSCGYFNGEFMCFTEPDIPDDPNKPPKKPVPEPDDNITDPLKKMADMNKQDLKEIQRGVESRLEGFNVSMDNALGELAAQGKNAEKAAGVGNKLLNSINQNTADTVKELKKLTGDESNPQPNYEETELGEKNDWQVRNFGTVMKAASDEILDKPMFQAIDGYFDVSFGGTCPTWNVSVWVFEVEINQFCDQSFQAILPLIRNVVILIFSILAFRVAFL